MKKIYYIFLTSFISYFTAQTYGLETQDLKDGIIPDPSTVSYAGNSNLEWLGFLDYVLSFLRDSAFALMALIAIGMFLFIGGKLLMARGNPEEFKKAMMGFVYAAVGIFVVAAAWAIVKLVAGIDI